MFYRWLHKSWKFFWRIVFVLLLVAVLLSGIAVGLLQLDVTKNYLANRIEQQIEQTYRADLSIGDIDGFLPFRLSLHDVILQRNEQQRQDTLLTINQIDSEIDVWGLLQNKLTIVGFSVQQPEVWLESDHEGKLDLLKRKTVRKKRDIDSDAWFGNVEIIAPSVNVSEGIFHLEDETREHQIGNLPPSFSLKNISASLFVDLSEQQQYLDIESFVAEPENLEIDNLAVSGQLYNDYRYLEFNSFYLTLGRSQVILNGEIDGVNLLEPNVTNQLVDAKYNLDISSDEIYLQDLKDLIANPPAIEQPISLDFRTEGSTDSLWIDRAQVGMGGSFMNINGLIENLVDRQQFAYQARIENFYFRNEDLSQLLDAFAIPQNKAVQSLNISGKANGSLNFINADLTVNTSLGGLAINGETQLKSPYKYKATVSTDTLDISPFLATSVDTTSLNLEADFQGEGLTLENGRSDLKLKLTDSRIGRHRFEELQLISELDDGILTLEHNYRNQGELIRGTSEINFRLDEPKISMKGDAENINLANFFGEAQVKHTGLNFDYNVELQGLNPDRIQGRANLDVKPSLIGSDTVRAHQFYADLNSPDKSTRELRLTSSLFDINISGQVTPSDVISQTKFWSTYLVERFESEILLNRPVKIAVENGSPPENNIVLDGSIVAKDLQLIKKYLPDFPTIYTDSQIAFNVNTDGTRLLLSADMQADTLQYNNLSFSDGSTQFTASFRSDRRLSEFSSVDWEANVSRLETELVDFNSLGIDLAVKQDSVYFTQRVGAISDDAEFRMALKSSISDSAVAVSVQDFFVGNKRYAWVNEYKPSITYYRSGEVDFEDFSFKNTDEYFRLQGRLSVSRNDSLTYTLRNINLHRISDLIKGEIDFDGVLNGTLVTKSLSRQPTVQGNLSVNQLKLNNRIVGDVRFKSRLNPDKDQFDTHINVLTDSTKYEEYLAQNDNIGQNIQLDGYLVIPEPSLQQDTLYYFDADFKEVDLWFLALILDNVFNEVEGQANGSGYIVGNFDDFDFETQFETQNVFARPRFLNTNYFLSGPIQFNRHEGVILDSLSVMDTKGGTGTVWGTVDLNDFDPITYLDLAMVMDNLQFLNNTMDPDVPFYGNVSGSGLIRLSGDNTDMYLRTEGPVVVTDDSQVSIPLLEETELQQTGKFIQFVDSFDEIDKKTATAVERPSGDTERDEDDIRTALENMSFSERFDLDLRFNAPENVNVKLIFDPVTGEVLTAGGTGQLQITMQDQEIQMFGRYNINGGNYQFVTGEIISRKLQLEPGGTIVWEGPPDNARLDISAVYNARPNVSTLLTNGESLDTYDQSGGQQVPIDLIVEVNGTLNSVENNYYFRLPSSLDLSSNSTLQYTLNQINRDEQQKLLQATSILFTGQFIPTQDTGSGTASLSQSLTRGSTVLNPLLSDQVISPLLSNQINALLNSDVSQLDVDFNLNAYNQVDLGIALRLYNDRLILRREGQITGGGQQSTLTDHIGDLNATYRIRKGLSLTAFHRQDQVFNSIQATGSQVGDITPYIDGVGLKSQVQFNTWAELKARIRKVYIGIFEKKKKSKE